MSRTIESLSVLTLLLALVALLSCGDGGEKDELCRRLQQAEAQLDSTRQELDVEREKVEARAEDFDVAAVVAFSCVTAAFLILVLLLRERRGRKALGRVLQAIVRRLSNGHT